MSDTESKKRDPLAREGLVSEWKQSEPYFEPLEGMTQKMARYSFNKPWRVMPDDKKEPVHKKASTKDAQVAVHPNAIVIGSPGGGDVRKGLSFYVYFTGAIALITYYMVYKSMPHAYHYSYYDEYWHKFENKYFIYDVFWFIFIVSFSIFATFSVIYGWLITYRSPPDYPILFNRKTRVITFFRQTQSPGLTRLWKLPIRTPASYSWDDAKIRTYRVFMSRFGKTFYYALWLQMLWGGKDGNPKRLKDYVAVGFEGYEEDDGLLQLWEHIRRYMEEDGPPIQPGERLRKPANKRKPLEFPPEIIAAAGGPALSEAEVLALAGLPTEQAAGA